MSEDKRLTYDELKSTPEYQKLTRKQQLFVATYCAGGLADGNYDAVNAAALAYKCRTREIARIMSYSLMANIKIVAVINRHFNATPTEEFMEMLDRAIHNKKITAAQVALLRLKCDILGIKTALPAGHETIADKQAALAQKARKRRKAEREEKIIAEAEPVVPKSAPLTLTDFLKK
jgi:hypothetical protein